MRAGRLLNLLLVLQNNGGRITARELAERLQVSERTVLRDMEVLSGSGVPVYAVRGRYGASSFSTPSSRPFPPLPPGLTAGHGRLRRVRVRLAPAALQLALVLGTPEGWRPRPDASPDPDRPDWVEGSFRFYSYDEAVRQLLALGVEVEVVLPVERETMAEVGREIADLHRPVDAGSGFGAGRVGHDR
ncbi:MAG: HTH domain-containing protein [Acidimicrobiales bacterium]